MTVAVIDDSTEALSHCQPKFETVIVAKSLIQGHQDEVDVREIED